MGKIVNLTTIFVHMDDLKFQVYVSELKTWKIKCGMIPYGGELLQPKTSKKFPKLCTLEMTVINSE